MQIDYFRVMGKFRRSRTFLPVE